MTSYLYVVPVDPWFVPAPDVEDTARRRFAELIPSGVEVESTVDDPMGYVHLVESQGTFRCPRCGQELDFAWLMGLLPAPAPEPVVPPCCRQPIERHELRSDGGDCYARFALRMRDPDCQEAPPEALAAIAAILGTPVVSAHQHI